MQWFYGVGGEQRGPVSMEQLKSLLAEGSLSPETVVWREGMGSWLPISQVPELAPAVPSAQVPPPALPPPASAPAPHAARLAASPQRLERKRPWSLTLLGILWLLVGALMTVVGAGLIFAVPPGEDAASMKVGLVLVAGVGALLFLAGLGLLRLKAWGRLLGILFGVLALVGFPLGTALGIVIIVYLVSPGIRLLYGPKAVEDMDAGESEQVMAAQKSGLGTALGVLLLLGALLPLAIGPLAAIAIPNYLNAVQRGKQKRTMGEIRTVSFAVESYSIDHGAYPDAAGTVAGLVESLQPTYIQALPTTDGWNNPIHYEIYDDGLGYWLWSHGKDGVSSGPEEGPCENFNDDIFFATGVFVTWPAGSRPE